MDLNDYCTTKYNAKLRLELLNCFSLSARELLWNRAVTANTINMMKTVIIMIVMINIITCWRHWHCSPSLQQPWYDSFLILMQVCDHATVEQHSGLYRALHASLQHLLQIADLPARKNIFRSLKQPTCSYCFSRFNGEPDSLNFDTGDSHLGV